ncbi:hypothetical protein ACTFIY_002069 [Dictyostelium cf. discoideum]
MVAPSFSTIQKQQQQQQKKSLSPKTTLITTTKTTITTTIIKEKYKNEKNTTTTTTTTTSNTNKPFPINSINNKNGLINESSTLLTLQTNVNSNELFVSCEKLSNNNNHHHQNEDDIVVSLIQTERVNIQKKLGA